MSNQNNPLVSVIIPCYNHEQFIQECIQSVIDQDYQNIELIIIDDGSQDNSVQKIEEMRSQCEERFVRFEFRHRPNKGLCVTLNEALTLIQGKYVAISASDDISLKNRVSISLDAIRRYGADVIFGNVVEVNERQIIQYYQESTYKYRQITFEDLFLRKLIPYAPTCFIKSNILLESGGFDTSFKFEDYPLWLKMAYEGRILVNIPDVLLKYRLHDSNMSSNIQFMDEEVDKILSTYRNDPLYSQAQRIYKTLAFNIASTQQKKYALDILINYPLNYFSFSFWKGLLKLILPEKIIILIRLKIHEKKINHIH